LERFVIEFLSFRKMNASVMTTKVTTFSVTQKWAFKQ